jgi:hypothetical protein
LLLGTPTSSFQPLTCVAGSLNIAGEVVLDSTSPDASVDASLFASIGAGEFYTASTDPGNAFTGFLGSISPSTTPVSGPVIADPYAGLTPPNRAALAQIPASQSTYTGHGSVTFQPGYYASTLTVNGSLGSGTLAQVTLASGIYYLNAGANINLANITSAPGGVFIYIAGGSLDLFGSATTLAPLASPPSPATNLVIWQAAADTNPIISALSTGTALIGGTIYAPGAIVGSAAGLSGGFSASSVVAAGIVCVAENISIGALPVVTSVSPAGGSIAGGNTVTIDGSHFLTGATVSFGNAAGTNVVVDPSGNSLTVTAPAGTGTVNVVVSTASGNSATSSAAQYAYS